jgi:hypothetical protein
VTKSHIEAANILARIQKRTVNTTDAQPRTKKGGPPGSKDTNPQQRKHAGQMSSPAPTPIVANLHINQGYSMPDEISEPDCLKNAPDGQKEQHFTAA